MPIGRYTIKLKRGDSWKETTMTVTDKLTGAPISMIGTSVLLQVRRQPDATVERSLSIGSGLEIIGSGDNVIKIAASTPVGLEAGIYLYDFQITWQDDTIETPFQGEVIVESDISQ